MSSPLPRRLPLSFLPTPVHPLPNMSRLFGREISIKRDDLTGLALGGNKARKLEFLMAAAQQSDADTVITGGAAQSNHCRQTAAAAARCGLRCLLVLIGHPAADQQQTGNLLLDHLLDAQIVWTGSRSLEAVMQEQVEQLGQAGHRPYLIPYGGSSPLGVVGYVNAFAELTAQIPLPSRIILASSSGGTQAGLAVGQHRSGTKTVLHGISVDLPAPHLRQKIIDLTRETCSLLGHVSAPPPDELLVDDRFCSAGYGIMTDREQEAIELFATQEGILLDPVYTGRAAGAMIELVRQGEIPPHESILFWHTGGIPALWAYAPQLTSA